jgi:hypothetical protein
MVVARLTLEVLVRSSDDQVAPVATLPHFQSVRLAEDVPPGTLVARVQLAAGNSGTPATGSGQTKKIKNNTVQHTECEVEEEEEDDRQEGVHFELAEVTGGDKPVCLTIFLKSNHKLNLKKIN